MILKTCLVLGTLLLADVPWWDDTSSSDAAKVTDTVKMPLEGGASSDGEYRICVIGNDPLDREYAFGFYSADGKSLLFQLNLNAGFCVLRGASEIDMRSGVMTIHWSQSKTTTRVTPWRCTSSPSKRAKVER